MKVGCMCKRRLLPFFTGLIIACGIMPRDGFADGEGFYLSVAGGAMLLRGNDLEGSTNLDPDYSTGFAVGGALGYELPALPIRFEAEVMYRSNDLDEISDGTGTILSGTGSASGGGSVNIVTAMANAYVFLPVLVGLEPYIGAGFGYASLDVDGLSGGAVSLVNGSADTYAYQFIVGTEFDFFPGPIDIGLEYRYLALAEERISGSAGSFDFDYQAHSVMARVRYSF
jgi:opacity protein-like surface antigen